jgi:hypothetical protein
MKNRREQKVPEARTEGLVVQHLTDEVLVYDQDRHKAHCLNRTAALVWEQCDGKSTASDIARRLSLRQGGEVEEGVVWLAVGQLAKTHLLKEAAVGAGVAVSRREVMRRIGVGAAVALPVVTSIVAPEAAQAANCRPSGTACTASPQCCSGVCNSGTCV